ncbi:hypothetical protein M758_1G067800 [Ceratodon purpureus]|nr:hypothetical protein M758_1G067800 [Ceratodon purpureus]KAG0628985.1 hypothetical protein M758_1G067800 [Ceratodon purpureus]
MENGNSAIRPHAVIFPFGALGHIRPLEQLARRLAHVYGFKVTFVVTSHFYKRMDFTDSKNGEDSIQYVDLEEGFPDSYYHMTALKTLVFALGTLGPSLKELLGRIHSEVHPVTCVISDQVFTEAHRTALHHGIPSVAFVTSSAMAVTAKYYGPRFIDEGLLPIPKSPAEAKEALSQTVTIVPGMHPMRLGDYHSGLWVNDITEPFFQYVIGDHSKNLHERDWILVNSIYELEAPLLEAVQQDVGIKFTTVGPLAITPITTTEPFDVNNNEDNKISNYSPEEKKCMDWLNKQEPTSVIYVSFGSFAVISASNLEKILLGLEDSQVPILMVMRPDLLEGNQNSIKGFQERTKERALFVSWAPQLKILAHPAIAGFLTHGGWNSFLESISMGVPFLCHPFFVDQPMVSRYIASVWKVGLELKQEDGTLDRVDVEQKVRALAAKESGIRANAAAWRDVVRGAVEDGGSSQRNMVAFVADMYKRAQAVKSRT